MGELFVIEYVLGFIVCFCIRFVLKCKVDRFVDVEDLCGLLLFSILSWSGLIIIANVEILYFIKIIYGHIKYKKIYEVKK